MIGVTLLLLFVCIATHTPPLVFNRVDVTADIHKHVYVKLYSFTKVSHLMYTMVVFRSPYRQLAGNDSFPYHNALLIGSHTYRRYYKITKDSTFVYNNEIPLIARGTSFMIPFSIVNDGATWSRITKTSHTVSSSGATLDTIDEFDLMAMDSGSTAAMAYHAILSLDHRSSIWDRYNIMTLTPYYMTFRYEPDGTAHRDVDEYGGIVRLQCQYTPGDNRCVIATHSLKLGDGTLYDTSTHRLIIDLGSSSNYLPRHLYFHLTSLSVSKATLSFDCNTEQLYLNNVFTYSHNPYDNDIIIGADLLHLFPKIEMAVETGELHLWYFDSLHIHNDAQEAVSILFTFLLLVALYCYFEVISNDPGLLFRLFVRLNTFTGRWFYFAVRQVFIELAILVVASLLMILTLFFTEYNSTQRCQRTILLSILATHHIILQGLILILTKRTVHRAFGCGTSATTPIYDRDFDEVRTVYLEDDSNKLTKEKTGLVIIRNTCLIVLTLLSVLIKVNFSSEESYLHLVLLFFVALIFLYFFVQQVTLGWLYWLNTDSNSTPPKFLLFLCCETVALVFYMTWSTFCIYLDYFHAVNSIYSDPFINALTIVAMSFIVLFACRQYQNTIEDIIQKDYLQ